MRFHPDEEMMDIETIARERSGSFLYTGCYRARGELTHADRAAWGLREPFARQLEHHLIAAPRSAGSAPLIVLRPQDCGRLAIVVVQPRCGGQHQRAGEAGSGQARVGEAVAMPKRARRFLLVTTSVRRSPHRWSRLRLKVEGEPATCLLLGERAFVTGAIAIARQGGA